MTISKRIRYWWLTSERLRYLIALILALLLLILVFSLPIRRRVQPLRLPFQKQELIQLQPERETATPPTPEIEITRWQMGSKQKSSAEAPPQEKTENSSTPSGITPGLKLLQPEKVLDFAQEQPEIIGGLRALYLRIQYPKAAREQGIEGRVIVEFIVEKDGTPSHVRVLQSAHPLLDSAAVQAIRRTTFTPGRQNDMLVRVRMRLPIRFRLLDHPAKPDSTREDSNRTSGTVDRDIVPLKK